MRIATSRLSSRLLLAVGVVLASACTSLPPQTRDADLLSRMAAADVVLIGELHDNVAQHRLRLDWLRALSDRVPITLVLEHLDADAQSRLDEARRAQDLARPVAERARLLAEAAGFRFDGWDWALIGPVIELALDRNLPIRAGNLSAREAFSIARGQPHPLAGAPPRGWSTDIERTLSETIREGHCGVLPDSMIPAMVRAQRARDARLAQVVADARAGGRTPVLLAGNGHVRTDFGVPLHLRDRLAGQTLLAIGLLEAPASSADSRFFDQVIVTDAQPRPDPCESLRKRFGAKPHG
jgi:uncharacterized iron-regulated protein